MQREMGLLGNVKREPQAVSADLLRLCKTRLDAIRLCVQLSGYSRDLICEELEIDKGHFSRMMSGRAHFPDAKSIDLMRLCGNYAPVQFEAMELGLDLRKDDKQARINELRRQLAEAEAA